MPDRTLSEELFESFCAENDLLLYRIVDSPSPQKSRAADYVLVGAAGLPIAVEVKQLDPSPQDRAYMLKLEEPNGPALASEPGSKVRPMIDAATPQLKATSRGVLPGLLVAYDNSGLPLERLEPYEIKAAMFGLEQVQIAVPKDPERKPYVTAHKFGPNRKVAPSYNRSLGAVAVLTVSQTYGSRLSVFHNHFAIIQIKPEALKAAGIRHFKLLPQTRKDQFAEWTEVTPTGSADA